jgi:hypothetical protein
MTDLELESSRSKKRRGPVEQLAESLICNLVPTPKSMPLAHPSGGISHSRVSTKRSLRSLDSNGKRDSGRTLHLSLSDFHTDDNGCYSAHSRRGS